MADSRFFSASGPFSLAQLAKISGAEPGPGADADSTFNDVAPLESAGAGDVSFFDNRRYLDRFAASRAGACVVEAEFAERAPKGMALLLTDRPYRAFALVAGAFYPEPGIVGSVDRSAIIDGTARTGTDCEIGPGAVIGAGAEIGDRVRIGPNAVIGAGVVVGDDTRIGAGASLSHCSIGSRVNLHPGVRIGQRGFGFAMDKEGHIDVPQLGRVVIEDDVEIGANSTVDRGAGPDTVIGAGSRIDNLVQIGHNVVLGRGCVVIAQSGISGSTKLDDNVILAAQSGLTGHLNIGTGAQIGAQAGVMRDVPAGARVMGSPAFPAKQFFRQVASLARLAQHKGKQG